MAADCSIHLNCDLSGHTLRALSRLAQSAGVLPRAARREPAASRDVPHVLASTTRRVLAKAAAVRRKQALPVKAFFATQDLSRCSLSLWSDEDLSDNEWLRPFAPSLTFRLYRPDVEVRGTPLEAWPALYSQRDRRVWRDGDLFRIPALHNHGGVYVDMDMVCCAASASCSIRSSSISGTSSMASHNGALMHLWKGSEFARELILGVMTIPAGDSNWGRGNLRRAIDRGRAITVFPSPFFDTEWQADPDFKPFENTPNSANLYEGAFAWHWHNRWDAPIAEGSKFQLLEARIDEKLIDLGFPLRPSVQETKA